MQVMSVSFDQEWGPDAKDWNTYKSTLILIYERHVNPQYSALRVYDVLCVSVRLS